MKTKPQQLRLVIGPVLHLNQIVNASVILSLGQMDNAPMEIVILRTTLVLYFVTWMEKQEVLAMMFDRPGHNRESFIHTRPALHQLETLASFLSTTKKSKSLERNQANTTLMHLTA